MECSIYNDTNQEKFKILVVEDNRGNAESIKELIEESDLYDVTIAKNATEARILFGADQYLIILLDLSLDGSIETGIELCQEFRKKDDNLYIVVMTAHCNALFDNRLVESADDFVRKPFDADYLPFKLLFWSARSKRRMRLKCYIESRLVDYEKKLNKIRQLDEQLDKLIQKTNGNLE